MKNKILFLLLIASIVLMVGGVVGMLNEPRVQMLSEGYVEEIYGKKCHNDIRTNIYRKDDGYAMLIRSNGEMSFTSIYLQIKLSIWWVVENILNAIEYNSLSSCEMG